MSFNYKKLRGKIRERFKTQENFAKELGISSVTLSAKLNNRVEFTRLEIDKSCEILGISKTAIPEFFFYPES